MEIYTYLKKDHKKVSGLLNEVVDSSDAHTRLALFKEIEKELIVHAESEQATFYKALNKTKKIADEAKHAKEEHKEIETTLKELSKLKADTDEWLIKFGELKSIVEHHVKEEEEEIFKEAKKSISKTRAESLVDEMEAKKEKIKEKLGQ